MAALAVLRRPDVFHVGVAGAPVCDWLDYDTHYTEALPRVPIGPTTKSTRRTQFCRSPPT